MGDKAIILIIAAIAVFLILANATQANNILNALGGAYNQQLRTLQGR